MNKLSSRNLLAASIFTAMLASQAYAQANTGTALSAGAQASTEQAPAASSTSKASASAGKIVRLPTVMVTAQRREQQIQKVPIAITTLNTVQLKHMQVTTLKDLRYVVPNILIGNSTGMPIGSMIFMRGIGEDDTLFTVDPQVATYIDGVYIPRMNAGMLDLFDVERIEVLRGPQGTLFGRNATAGAIRYITQKPDGKDRLDAEVSLGNYARRDVHVNFGTKIGQVDVSGAVMSLNNNGWMHDLTNHRMVNGRDTNGARLELATALTDNTYARLTLNYLDDNSGNGFASPAELNAQGQAVPKLGSYAKTVTNLPGIQNVRDYGIAFNTDSDFGSFSLRNTLAAGGMHQLLYGDFSATAVPLLYDVYEKLKERRYSYEAQLTSEFEGPFSWVGGFFALRETNSQPTRIDFFVTGPTDYVSQQDNSYALYWQGTYKFTDQLSLIGGTRYSWEHKNFLDVALNPDGTSDFNAQHSQIWRHPDWKVGLNYDFTEKVMGYASATTGFQSGGFNGRAATAALANPVAPERVRSDEIGVKSSLFNDRMTLDVDYYYSNWEAMQLSALLPNGSISLTNATGALIQGVEMSSQVQLTSQWHAGVGFGTINAKYRNYAAINAATFEGLKLKQAPRFQWYMNSTYNQPLANADLVGSIQLKYIDQYYENQDNNAVSSVPTHLDVGAQISYEPRGKSWSVALWGKNLTNNIIPVAVQNIPVLGVAAVFPSEPRTYGVDFTYHFF